MLVEQIDGYEAEAAHDAARYYLPRRRRRPDPEPPEPVYLFFFQAADGIRDFHVTGVQTCALPIWLRLPLAGACRGLRPPRATPSHHPPLPPAHERKGRALHPHAPRRLGLRSPLRLERGAHGLAFRLARPLQLATTTRQPQPQAARRSSPRAEQPG